MTHVLIVEDDADLLYIYRTALARAGYEVTLAKNPEEALAVLRTITPRVIFLDMMMPSGSGKEVIDYVQATERLHDARVVIVTANDRWQKALSEDDIDLFLVKPVRIDDLVSLADQLTGSASP